jgi:hypothetical protein
MSCKKQEILNPVSKKCVKLKSEVGKVILHYEKLAGLIDESFVEEEVDNSFYDIIKGKREGEGMTKFELLQYLSDLTLKSDECIELKKKFPLLKSIEPTTNIDPIQYLLEDCLNEQAQRGQLFETIWDIFIKLGFSKFGKDYYHILNNVNIERLEEQYLEDAKLLKGIKYMKYADYFGKKCISGNSTGVSDISLKHKNIKINDTEACEDVSTTEDGKDDSTTRVDIPEAKKQDTIYISCKYYLDDSKKRITDYDLQNILSLIKNKYKTEIDSGKELPDFTIYLFVKDKKKVIDVINNSNKSSEYLRKNIKSENIWDLDDLKEVYWNFYNFMNTFRKHNDILNENIYKIAIGETVSDTKDHIGSKPEYLKLRFHQEYAIAKSLQNIGEQTVKMLNRITKKIRPVTRPEHNITQVWGMIPRSGKTYIAGGFLREYSKKYTKEKCKALIITSAPTETKSQWLELFNFADFKGWLVKVIDAKQIDYTDYDEKQNLVYIASKQYLDTKIKDKTNEDDETEAEIPNTKLQKLVKLSKDIKFNVIIFDENHLGGTTKLAKQTLDRFGENANKLLLTATFNKSIDKFDIPLEHLITWDLNDLALCKQLEEPRKLTELVEKHISDEKIIKEILLNSYGINYDYYTGKKDTTYNILENYYTIKGVDGIKFIEELYKSENAKKLWDDLYIYPDIKVLLNGYDIDILKLIEHSNDSEDIKIKCKHLCKDLTESVKINNGLMNEQRSKMNVFTETYKQFPDIHFIGLSFDNTKLKEILEAKIETKSNTKYTFSMSDIFKTSAKGEGFEIPEAIDKLLEQIAGGVSIPYQKSLYNSIRKISSKYGSRTFQDDHHFTSQLWFIPFGKTDATIKKVSAALKKKLELHQEFKKYDILSLYDDDVKKSTDIKQTIKKAEKDAKQKNKKKGLIILSGSKLNVGVSLKCVDIVFLMNDVISYDTIYQSMFRSLTESINKKVGFIVDLNPIRMITAIYKYSNKSKINQESQTVTLKKNIRNMLFYIDDHLFEYEDNIERSNKIIQIINDINKNNPNLRISLIEKKLTDYIDDIEFTSENIEFLKRLYEDAKDIIDDDKRNRIKLIDNYEETTTIIDKLSNGNETDQSINAVVKRTMEPREVQRHKVKNIGLIIIPFIKLFVILSIDDKTSMDLISMYKYVTSPTMVPILLDKLDKWGIGDKERFFKEFGHVIKTICDSSEEQFINNAILNMSQHIIAISQNSENISKQRSFEGGSNSKLSYILNNIQKINIGYKQFHDTLVKLKMCNNTEQTSNMYIINYLNKFDYLF